MDPAISHKRTYSSMEPELVEHEELTPEATVSERTSESVTPTHVLLIHLNALLSSAKAITRTVHRTIEEALGHRTVPLITDEAIIRAFSKRYLIDEILAQLGIDNLTQEEFIHLSECYPRIYKNEGLPLVSLASHARELLEEVKRQNNIAFAVVSNNPPNAQILLIRLGIGGLVDWVRTESRHLPWLSLS